MDWRAKLLLLPALSEIRSEMMKKVAITGTIGAGKTTLAILLQRRGYAVFNADAYGRLALQKGHVCYEALRRHFGCQILDEHAEIVPKKLASVIFADEAEREFVNRTIHPFVLEGLRAFFNRHQGDVLVFAEVPLLFESGWEKEVDEVIVVTCTKRHALKRLVEDRGYTKEEAQARFSSQIDGAMQIAKADDVFHNDGSVTALDRQLSSWLQRGGY